MEEDLISVIVPVYKVEKYLKKCIESIINQTYKNLEIILVDDGSTDNCPQICDEYAKKDNRIKVIHKINGGLSDARNTGIQQAKGNYIGFIDSDDWISTDFFMELYILLKKSNADIAVCNVKRTCNENDIKNNKKKVKEIIYDKNEYLKRYLKIGHQTTEYYAWNKLYKRELISEEQYPKGLTSEDVFGTYKAILKSKKIAKVEKEMYFYRYNDQSITGKFSNKDFDLIKIWDMVVKYSKEFAPQYYEWTVLNRKRINFTLLFRMAKNYEVSELRSMEITSKLLKDLKRDKKVLLKADIPISRKIIIVFFCQNYFLFASLLRKVSAK